MDFWIPKYKWQLVFFLGKMYPENKSKFNRMGKKKLYAIYFHVRNKGKIRKVAENVTTG